MIYIMASATTKGDKFSLKYIYVADEQKMTVLDATHDFNLVESSSSYNALFQVYKSQEYFVNNLVYTTVRQLSGNDASVAINALSKQLNNIKGVSNFDLVAFETINGFGVEANG